MAKKHETEETKDIVADVPVEEDYKATAETGYLFGISINHFTKHTRVELREQGFTEADIARIEKVLAAARLTIGQDETAHKAESKASLDKFQQALQTGK